LPDGPEKIVPSLFVPEIAVLMVFANNLELANVSVHGKVMIVTPQFVQTAAPTTEYAP